MTSPSKPPCSAEDIEIVYPLIDLTVIGRRMTRMCGKTPWCQRCGDGPDGYREPSVRLENTKHRGTKHSSATRALATTPGEQPRRSVASAVRQHGGITNPHCSMRVSQPSLDE